MYMNYASSQLALNTCSLKTSLLVSNHLTCMIQTNLMYVLTQKSSSYNLKSPLNPMI